MSSKHFKTLLVAIIIIFILGKIFEKDKSYEGDAIVITPEVTGGEKKEISKVSVDTVYIEKIVKEENKIVKERIIVDSTYKKRYEEAIKENDSLKAKNIFLESIKINEFKGTLVEDSKITIKGKIKTRGNLLGYDIDYTIKKDSISYTPKVEYRHPSLSLIYGADVIVPTGVVQQSNPVIVGKLGLQFKKGDIVTLGITSQSQVLIGYSKTIRLFK